MTITLYSTTYCPYAWRTRIVLHEKEVPFEVFEVDLKNKQQEFLEVSPTGMVPLFIDDGTRITDSMVVNEYIEEKYPRPNLLGEAPAERAAVRAEIVDLNWNRSQPLAKLAAMFLYNCRERDRDRVRRQLAKWNAYLDELDKRFEADDWLVLGRYSMADISLYATVAVSSGFGIDTGEERRALRGWLARMEDRGSVRRSAPQGLPVVD
mgnify:CR=1 FL=1